MARHRRRSVRARGNNMWANLTSAYQIAAGASVSQIIVARKDLQLQADIEPPEATLRRVVGSAWVAVPTSGPVDMLAGLFVVDNDEAAFAVNTARMADERCIWVATGYSEVNAPLKFDLSTKGQAKLGPDQELRLVMTNVDSFGTTETVRVTQISRALLTMK